MKDAQHKSIYANEYKGRVKDRNINNLGSNQTKNQRSCCNIRGLFEILSVGKFHTKNTSESTDRTTT